MAIPETDSSLVGQFSVLEDPRDVLWLRYSLLDTVIIAIDCKMLHHSDNRANGLVELHLVSA